MVLTNAIMKARGSSNNHFLLFHLVTWHLEKYKPLHFPHTKCTFYDIVNTWMQMVKMLLLTILMVDPFSNQEHGTVHPCVVPSI
jgi:hypothetical protein